MACAEFRMVMVNFDCLQDMCQNICIATLDFRRQYMPVAAFVTGADHVRAVAHIDLDEMPVSVRDVFPPAQIWIRSLAFVIESHHTVKHFASLRKPSEGEIAYGMGTHRRACNLLLQDLD